MSARTARTRLLAAAALAVATLSLTACNNGEGVRDEGASAGTSSVAPSSKGSEGATTGKGTAAPVGSSSKGTESDKDSQGTAGSSGSGGSSGSKGSSGSTGASDSDSDSTLNKPCTTVRTAATEVSRPLNHLLLTVTNTGSKNCDLAYYPAVRLGEAQSVPPVFEDSQPQAVVTLAPGESGYAGVLLSAADGSGSDGYTAKSMTLYINTDSQKALTPSLPAKGVHVDSSVRVTYWQATMDDALAW
ncbi:DUF4232 domain-containing protein [Streptomyces aurantiacus]|uniref:DUF4232 domain-containing protein n=1 Tax=Streptomyces aurantiacus TaxID=47760 RepID=A0A7G1P3P3_9ACTN|nr:DUF4232 domain-containing protein [Streptomyces aurantiacus]BCL29869.1 hypothetical protein GCM10017557_47280 [Streptomyces aurantiacus]